METSMAANVLAATVADLNDSLETAIRTDGSRYTKMTDNAPEWVKAAVYSAHGDSMPNDSIYEMIRVASEIINYWVVANFSAKNFDDADMGELIDSSIPVYNYELKQWLLNNSGADEAVESVISDGLYEVGRDFDLYKMLMAAYYWQLESIVQILRSDIEMQVAATA